jgi:serine protease SohB
VGQFFSAYGLFLVEIATVLVIVLAVVVVLIASARRAGQQPEGLSVTHLNREFQDAADVLRRELLDKREFKKRRKGQAKSLKQRKRGKSEARPRVFVLDFKGDIRATATASLTHEVSAVLAVAKDGDRVLLRLENAGGMVHEHGLAASQLLRIKRRGIPLAIAVDKVAASGGYLMACVADRLMAAPFAIVGSIGVIAQLPNFHRLLEQKGVDFEQITAGRFKRTLTLFGENTEEGRRKLKEELEDVHLIFKSQIAEHRPQIELDRVATGEHWYGIRALELKLIDELATSDDYLIDAAESCDLYRVSYRRRHGLAERLLHGAEGMLSAPRGPGDLS